MITTRRSYNGVSESYSAGNSGGVGVLERVPETYNEYKNPEPVREENMDEARARMQRNLDKLMNYDRYSEISASAIDTIEPEVMPEMDVQTAISQDEDIQPTSTTMQFGNGDLDQMYREMDRADKQESYQLNGKGKLAVVLYSLVVTVILALIIINTGVLASIKDSNVAKQAELNQLMSETTALQEQVSEISGDNYVSDLAEDLGMRLE